jgi:hypothetical protein
MSDIKEEIQQPADNTVKEGEKKEILPILFIISMVVCSINIVVLFFWGMFTNLQVDGLFFLPIISSGVGLILLSQRKLWGLYIFAATIVFVFFSMGLSGLYLKYPGAIIHLAIMIRYSAWLE